MLEKDKFLEKTSYLIFLIFVFFSEVLIAETTITKILNYNLTLLIAQQNLYKMMAKKFKKVKFILAQTE